MTSKAGVRLCLSEKKCNLFFPLISDPLLSPSHLSPSSYFKPPRPLALDLVDSARTKRQSDIFSSSQFYSAENFSSFLDLDSTGEPVREISDQELTRLGFPIPTRPPDQPVTERPSVLSPDFPIVDSPFFQIISRKYNDLTVMRPLKIDYVLCVS